MKKRSTPLNSQLRPIGARALKSACDTLRPWLGGARVADLYAGQGRFGCMALDEGAHLCAFIEKHGPTARSLATLLQKYSGRGSVLSTDVATWVSASRERFDIVFADPPFDLWNDEYARWLLSAMASVAAPSSILLVKAPTRMVASMAFSHLDVWKQTKVGESTLIYFRYGEASNGHNEP